MPVFYVLRAWRPSRTSEGSTQPQRAGVGGGHGSKGSVEARYRYPEQTINYFRPPSVEFDSRGKHPALPEPPLGQTTPAAPSRSLGGCRSRLPDAMLPVLCADVRTDARLVRHPARGPGGSTQSPRSRIRQHLQRNNGLTVLRNSMVNRHSSQGAGRLTPFEFSHARPSISANRRTAR